MTIEELKEELNKAGYATHKKVDEKLLKRRASLYFQIFDYVETSRYVIWRKTRKYVSTYLFEQSAQNIVRKKMKEKYGSIDYGAIPDDEWLTVKQELFEVAKCYIDRRFKKAEAGL